MVHNRTWYKRNGAALIMATLGFPDEATKWAYSCIIDMLNDRDRPLTDDAGFICGFTGLTRKKWAIVRRYLLSTEDSSGGTFLMLTDRGDLTNPRFERERAERRQAHEAAVEFGTAGGKKSAALRAAGQGDLELETDSKADDESPRARAPAHGQAGKSAESTPKGRGESTPNSHPNGAAKAKGSTGENNDLAEPPPQATRARKRTEIREEDSPHPDSESNPPAPDRLADFGLQALYENVAEASGHNPASPDKISRAYRFVQAWRDDGIDFDKVVIPTIKAVVAGSGEPTRTLGRFDQHIRHEHARKAAKGANGTQAYRPPQSPSIVIDGEDPAMADVRKDLLERLGARAYCMLANDVRFEAVADAGRGRKPLRVVDNRNPASRLMDGDRVNIVRNIALRHGFTEVW